MSSPTLINTKLIFRAYAVLAAILGMIGLDGNAGVLLGAELQPAFLVVHPTDASPWGQYVVPRLAGTVLIMAALIALAFARLDDAEARRRSLVRFAIAHVIFGFLFSGITSALLTPILPQTIVWAPLVVGIVLASFAIVNAQAQPIGHTSADAGRGGSLNREELLLHRVVEITSEPCPFFAPRRLANLCLVSRAQWGQRTCSVSSFFGCSGSRLASAWCSS